MVTAVLANWKFSTIFPVYCHAFKTNLVHSRKDLKGVGKADGRGAG